MVWPVAELLCCLNSLGCLQRKHAEELHLSCSTLGSGEAWFASPRVTAVVWLLAQWGCLFGCQTS
jgi:hypothetical protein